ncbi:hypothetical protein KO465_02990 [Candidatus Micrarchaeota archaeon]|nr:hypothetical protein [Candidatus Micrarchaeota archaeon]
MDETYEKLNREWKSTCKLLFGGEIGNLNDYKSWLKTYYGDSKIEKSAISKKEIHFSSDEYCKKAKYLSLEEVDFNKKYDPLNINELKDIDSIVEAVQDRIYYTGGAVLGSSQAVETSSDVSDSHYIYNSDIVADSKYIGFSKNIRSGEYLFGVNVSGASSYAIRIVYCSRTKRCFETYGGWYASDCYYTSNISDCSNCMFSFGLVNKSYCIGNLQLSKDEYTKIKNKLLEDMREKLKKEKKLFSLFDVIEKSGKPDINLKLPTLKNEEFDKKEIEKGFSSTTSILFGKPLGGVDGYQKFLEKHVPSIRLSKSCLTGNKVVEPGYIFESIIGEQKVRDRIITSNEISTVGETQQIDKSDLNKIRWDLDSLSDVLQKVVFISPDLLNVGQTKNLFDVVGVGEGTSNCYKSGLGGLGKYWAFSHWTSRSSYMYGALLTWYSSFCIKTYNSKKLTRCFEVDASENCSDLYYSHNCENVHDSMFCFNVKNLRNAIGNAPLPSTDYKKIKINILTQIADELEKKKDLKWDIYNIGCVEPI